MFWASIKIINIITKADYSVDFKFRVAEYFFCFVKNLRLQVSIGNHEEAAHDARFLIGPSEVVVSYFIQISGLVYGRFGQGYIGFAGG
jgi:hypothetical protein